MFPNLVLWLMLVWSSTVQVPPLDQPLPNGLPPGMTCPYGCIVASDGWAYQMERNDLTWMAKLAMVESGPRFVREEASATVWAVIQNFVRVNRHRNEVDRLRFGTFVQNYSAALSKRWSSQGTRHHARITPRADRYRPLTWLDLPKRWRQFAVEVVCARVSNRSPGYVHVLARGFEERAAPDLIGPWYATTEDVHPGGNAYYAVPESRGWGPDEVRIVPATADMLCLFVD
jgi:hypothetical protein